jgi:hypothetical protein
VTAPRAPTTASPPARSLTLVEILTVGLPFCLFKAACGVVLLGAGRLPWLGWLLVAWGAADTVLNGVNAITVGALGRRGLSVCLLQALTRAVRHTERSANLGTALDLMLSFVLVAVMIGTGALSRLSPAWLSAWNGAVVLNVLGAGALRLADALRRQG